MQRPQPPGGAGLRTTAQRLLAGALEGGMLPYAGALAEPVLPVAGEPEVPVEPIPVEPAGLLSVEGVVLLLGAGVEDLLALSALRLQALRVNKADSATATAATNFRLKAYIAVPFKN